MELEIKNMGKCYKGKIWGLKNFSLTLGPDILGLCGPNGAGKSTLMRILATITQPSEGKVYWNGEDIKKKPNAIREVLGYLPQDFGVYPNLNAMEFLEYIAAIKGLDGRVSRQRINELLQVVNLVGVRKQPLSGYSGGMKQRVGIAQALLNDPHLLIVDEPTTSLDPEERVRFRNLLSDLSGDRIVILSTHIISDVEAAATEIALIQNGYLLTHTTPEGLLKEVQGKVWEWIVPSSELTKLRQEHLVSSTLRSVQGVEVRVVSNDTPSPEARLMTPRLEDAYLYYMRNGRGW